MITTSRLAYSETSYFSQLVLDYLNDEGKLKEFYDLRPTKEHLLKSAKSRFLDGTKRQLLVNQLRNQYKNLQLGKDYSAVFDNIDKLGNSNTVTITTGHQLCLFTGPLYFIYKIVSTINLCKKLNEEMAEINFVPVYWMASEDHDFEEINHFNLFGKRLEWNHGAKGAVGHMETDSLTDVANQFSEILGNGENAERLRTLFNNTYLKNSNLANATRYLVNELFHQYGLVCLDGDDAVLKSLFKEQMKSELLDHGAQQQISATSEKLGEHYKIQVNPREINLFLLNEGKRERIVANEGDDGFHLSESEIKFNRGELLTRLEEKPEDFSPNVAMRPLYQEVILPNIAYIGGGGEIAYWLQLKSFFKSSDIPFPILILRNSVMWVDKTSAKKLKKNDVDRRTIFKPLKDILGEYARKNASVELSFEEEERQINAWYEKLIDKAERVDQGMTGYLKAESQKSRNMLQDLEKKLVRAEKKNQENGINQITSVKEKLFPNGSLQERYSNFSELYLMYGDEFLTTLLSELDPLRTEFTILIDEVN